MDIGNKIKQLRTRQGLTLEELASRSELTKGFLSQLERDLTSPSIDSLSDILEALVPNTQKNQMEPILLELPAGGESFEVEPHNGEEFGYVLEGSVILECDGERSVVRRGETFYLHGKTFHCLKNERKTAARVLWVCTPPLF